MPSRPGSAHRVGPGTRIRERRLAQGRAQADLAREAGISPAYLNLIEHDRRQPPAALLARLAEVLGVRREELESGREEALIADLRAAAAAVALGGEAELPAASPSGSAVEISRVAEFAARFPGWAGALAQAHARAEALDARLIALSERMTQDPYLSTTLHEVLSAITSLRATASILVQDEEMAPEWRGRFYGNLDQDSQRLASTAQALVAYLDSFESESRPLTPLAEFEEWEARGRPQDGLVSDAAMVLAQEWSDQDARDSALLPDAELAPMLNEISDPVRMSEVTGQSVALILRRWAALVPEAGLMICDASGALIRRRVGLGMSLPREGNGCALLPLYAALGAPGSCLSHVIETVEATRWRCFSYGERLQPEGSGGPVLARATMLVFPEQSDMPDDKVIAVGPACRICPRASCAGRREPSVILSV